MERWTDDQLEQGHLNWNCLPQQLQSCGQALHDALQSQDPLRSPGDQGAHRGAWRVAPGG